MPLWKFVTVSFMLVICSNANADIVALDDPVFGANSITFDTSTRLGFLDLTITQNLSYNDIMRDYDYSTRQFRADSQYYGFRYASLDDVSSLLSSAGITLGVYDTDLPKYQTMVDMLGSTMSQSGYAETCGRTSSRTSVGARTVACLDFGINNGTPVYLAATHISLYDDVQSDYTGNWLVKEMTPVPVPEAVWLLGSGLIALAGFARRYKG